MNLPVGVKASRLESKVSSFTPLNLSWQERVQPRFRVGLPTSNDLIKKIPHRDFRFELIPGAVTLTARTHNQSLCTKGKAVKELTSFDCPSWPKNAVGDKPGPAHMRTTWALTRAKPGDSAQSLRELVPREWGSRLMFSGRISSEGSWH